MCANIDRQINVLHLLNKQTLDISLAGKMHMFVFCVFLPMFLTFAIFHYIPDPLVWGEVEKRVRKAINENIPWAS